jgi:hypothetical protein
MAIKKITLDEFREQWNGRGESVVALADHAQRYIKDDDEFVAAAKLLIDAEDHFAQMMIERHIVS